MCTYASLCLDKVLHVFARDVTFRHMEIFRILHANRTSKPAFPTGAHRPKPHRAQTTGLLIKEHFFRTVSWCFHFREAQTDCGTVCFGERRYGMKGEPGLFKAFSEILMGNQTCTAGMYHTALQTHSLIISWCYNRPASYKDHSVYVCVCVCECVCLCLCVTLSIVSVMFIIRQECFSMPMRTRVDYT